MGEPVKLPPVYWIEWVDSNMNHGWRTKGEIARKKEHLSCYSIGFLIEETDDTVSFSASWDLTDGFADAMTIPKVAITKMREVDFG